jgi:DNA-binding FadR family transcriptional regulator
MRRGAGELVAPATEADFVRMKEHLDALERATDQQSFREAGHAFHLEIARATRNPLLVRIFEMIIEARARAVWNKLRYLNDHREAQLQQIESPGSAGAART